MHLVEVYKNVGSFFRVTPLLQKLLAKNTKKHFKKIDIDPFPVVGSKNPSAIRKNMTSLTKVDIFQIHVTFF